jgi:hypothetical protein
MNVRLTFTGKSIFEHLLGQQPELAKLRDLTFRQGHTPTRDEKIEFGLHVDAGLNQLRGEISRRLEDLIAPKCTELKSLPARSEAEMARMACLVDKEATAGFDAAVQAAARTIDDRFTVEQGGPFPPYDFAELHLTADQGAEGAHADP